MLRAGCAFNKQFTSARRSALTERRFYSGGARQHFWLRHEVKPSEARSALLPEHVEQLVKAGHKVTVEKSSVRCVPDAEYAKVASSMVETGTWEQLAPHDAVILGLKELPENPPELVNNHIYFGHAYKGQKDGPALMKRFKKGGGKLWDLEYLVHENGKRVAAFGKSAGIAGAAMGIKTWAQQRLTDFKEPLPSHHGVTYKTLEMLAKDVGDMITKAKVKPPKVLVIGALGRSGSGACEFSEMVPGVEVTKWDIAETRSEDVPAAIRAHDIFINCVFVDSPMAKPFITMEQLKEGPNQLTVVADVSCDANNVNNPIPIYKEYTEFSKPTRRILDGEKPIDIVAIDHLPSLIPEVSSREFANDMMQHYLTFPTSDVWQRNHEVFKKHVGTV